MLGSKQNNKVEKLPGPRAIPGIVSAQLVKDYKLDPDLAQILMATIKKRTDGEQKIFDIRIFDNADAQANKVEVKDYTTLEDHADLILYDGWFDESTKKVELTEKKRIVQEVTLFDQDEIQRKIEVLSDPGGTTFFYMARGPAIGGPLGRGATVVELTPQVQGKKQKKYRIYTADVVNMSPVGKGSKIFDSDKSKDIAKWIKEAHHKRMY